MDVARLINKALSNDDIQRILGGAAKIIKYSELGHLYDIDQLLPDEKDYCILLYDERPNRGHWTDLSKHNGLYEHFDSYGNKPGSELKSTGEKKTRAEPRRALPDLIAQEERGEVHLQQRSLPEQGL